jgi:hypothetical protein
MYNGLVVWEVSAFCGDVMVWPFASMTEVGNNTNNIIRIPYFLRGFFDFMAMKDLPIKYKKYIQL